LLNKKPKREVIKLAVTKIGTVKGKNGNSHSVEWDEYSHDVWIDNGWYHAGTASSARQAIYVAEAYAAQNLS